MFIFPSNYCSMSVIVIIQRALHTCTAIIWKTKIIWLFVGTGKIPERIFLDKNKSDLYTGFITSNE